MVSERRKEKVLTHLVKHGEFALERHPVLVINLINSFGIMGPETAFITSANLCNILKNFAADQCDTPQCQIDNTSFEAKDLHVISNCLLIISHSKHS